LDRRDIPVIACYPLILAIVSSPKWPWNQRKSGLFQDFRIRGTLKIDIFPVYSLFMAEQGSQMTASTAIKSAL
jgi:hypothetical protein